MAFTKKEIKIRQEVKQRVLSLLKDNKARTKLVIMHRTKQSKTRVGAFLRALKKEGIIGKGRFISNNNKKRIYKTYYIYKGEKIAND